jgi:exopolysaccharide production protein ExoY
VTIVATAELIQRSNLPSLGGPAKRAMDIAVASLALVLVCPLMLMLLVLVHLSMGGPALFAHRRVGCNGKAFRCLKFRTMVTNADEVLQQYLANNPDAAAEWATSRKLQHDPRVTALGRLLRKSSLDELPQLINILRGEMSCVGPRPITADELGRYAAHAPDYLSTRPGLTGLWQVSGRSSLSYEHRIALDSTYVRNWSLWLDIVLMLKTIPAVIHAETTPQPAGNGIRRPTPSQ